MATQKKPVKSGAAKKSGAAVATKAADATAKKKQFFSPDGDPIRVTLPGSGVAIVTDEPRELPANFHRAAIKAGCHTTDGIGANVKIEQPAQFDPDEREALIRAAINRALEADENSPGYEEKYGEAFTTAGKPSVRWLEHEVGFPIDMAERDRIWAEIDAELERESEEEETENSESGNPEGDASDEEPEGSLE